MYNSVNIEDVKISLIHPTGKYALIVCKRQSGKDQNLENMMQDIYKLFYHMWIY